MGAGYSTTCSILLFNRSLCFNVFYLKLLVLDSLMKVYAFTDRVLGRSFRSYSTIEMLVCLFFSQTILQGNYRKLFSGKMIKKLNNMFLFINQNIFCFLFQALHCNLRETLF